MPRCGKKSLTSYDFLSIDAFTRFLVVLTVESNFKDSVVTVSEACIVLFSMVALSVDPVVFDSGTVVVDSETFTFVVDSGTLVVVVISAVLAVVVDSGTAVVDSETFAVAVGFGTVVVDSGSETFAVIVGFGVLAVVVRFETAVVDSDDEVFAAVVVVLDSGTLVVVSIDFSVTFLTSIGDEIVVDSP